MITILLRAGLVLACLVLLLSLTLGNAGIKNAFTDYFETNSVFGVFGKKQSPNQENNAGIIIGSRPSWPGCSAFRRLSAEQIAAKVRPSVVGIIQYQKGALQETGEGSGIVMSDNGYILTNNHVVDGAYKISVVLYNGKKYTATLIGKDERSDIAVIKIDTTGLTEAQFGNSDQCSVGEQVIAIGNPSGIMLAGSVTLGIISAIDRNVDVGNGPMNLIQTDAAINPGNSGGALVNMYGQVVGINSAKISQQGFEGIGFSIPVQTAKPVVDSIMKYGYVKGRVKFGFNCRSIDDTTAKMNGIPAGIYIDYVEPSGSAAQAGLKEDDIITGIDGTPVKTTDELIAVRDKHKPGDELTLDVYRHTTKQELTLKLKLSEEPKDSPTLAADGKSKAAGW